MTRDKVDTTPGPNSVWIKQVVDELEVLACELLDAPGPVRIHRCYRELLKEAGKTLKPTPVRKKVRLVKEFGEMKCTPSKTDLADEHVMRRTMVGIRRNLCAIALCEAVVHVYYGNLSISSTFGQSVRKNMAKATGLSSKRLAELYDQWSLFAGGS